MNDKIDTRGQPPRSSCQWQFWAMMLDGITTRPSRLIEGKGLRATVTDEKFLGKKFRVRSITPLGSSRRQAKEPFQMSVSHLNHSLNRVPWGSSTR